MKVAVIKYNAGNIRSVDYALKRLGVEAVITSDKEVLKAADKVIFPGVGEAETTMLHLKESGMDRFIKELRQPVLGICRGIQFLNVYLGGTLYQDLPTEHPSAAEHHQKPPYDVPVHSVTLVPARPLYQLLGKCELAVNSLHHQAIRKLAPTLQVMALSEDGIPEAICLPGKKFVWAVQWHPEFSFPVNADSRKIFAAFVGAC